MTPFSTRLATVFGIGWFPFAPGTAASFVALPLGWILIRFGWQSALVGAGLAMLIGIWACGLHARKAGRHDPSECVLDEVAGQWTALLPIALMGRGDDWRPFAMAFLLFRLFDITKPWPVARAERLPGGLGIMADDIVAGAFAAAILYGTLAIRLV